jgi:hypothetical protein
MNDIHPILTLLQEYQHNEAIRVIKLQNILNQAKDQEGAWIPNEDLRPATRAAIIKLAKHISK